MQTVLFCCLSTKPSEELKHMLYQAENKISQKQLADLTSNDDTNFAQWKIT